MEQLKQWSLNDKCEWTGKKPCIKRTFVHLSQKSQTRTQIGLYTPPDWHLNKTKCKHQKKKRQQPLAQLCAWRWAHGTANVHRIRQESNIWQQKIKHTHTHTVQKYESQQFHTAPYYRVKWSQSHTRSSQSTPKSLDAPMQENLWNQSLYAEQEGEWDAQIIKEATMRAKGIQRGKSGRSFTVPA